MISERGMEPGTIIYNSYVIESVLGEGGFGITYLAVKQDTNERVAVKEYFPSRLAVRKKDSDSIAAAERDREEYNRGKAHFIREASILMEFRYLQGIVKVWDCFEANNTAYIVMDYIDGITLKEYISCHGGMSYPELMKILSPILKSLITLHRHGVIHRDISPDNLMIGMDNSLYLIDFGAAREMDYKTTTVLLKAGYAPPEQYLHDGELGAWTDVYALCATIYTALCGRVPADAVARLQGKELVPLKQQGVTLKAWQWNAIAKGMSMRAAERFRSMDALYDALTVEPTEEDLQTIAGSEVEPSLRKQMQGLNETKEVRLSNGKKRFAAAVLLAFLLCVGLYYGGSRRLGQEANHRQETDAGQTEALSGEGAAKVATGKYGDTKDDAKTVTDKDAVKAVTDEDAGNKDTAALNQGDEQASTENTSPRLCRMPDVTGMGEKAAKAKIANEDGTIRIEIAREYSATVERNKVIGQNVAPDTQYNEGAIKEVVLTVSDGAQPASKTDGKATATDNKANKTTKAAATDKANKTTKEKTDGKKDSYDVESDGNEAEDFYLND